MAKPSTIVRQMKGADISAMARILEENGLGEPQKLHGPLSFLLRSNRHFCFVAERDRRIVGGLMGFFNGLHAYINYLAVDKKHQERGIATLLHTQFVKNAKRVRARGIIVDSWLTTTGFYFKLGYTLPGAVFLIRRFDRPRSRNTNHYFRDSRLSLDGDV